MPQAPDIAEAKGGHDAISRLAPAPLRPYLRLARVDKPIGVWLLMWPCWWSLALAAQGRAPLALLGLFAAGAFVMRGAGCTYNDIIDRDIDARVARTRTRPLASGQVRLRGAIAFLALQLLAGLAILLSFNAFAVALGAASLVLVFTYPFMKRITYWPQAFLGITFNWGALLGWAAIKGELGIPAVVLYAGCVAWTLGYDTIYAHQDKEDDARAGIRSSALLLGPRTRPWLFLFYAGALSGWAAAGWLAGAAWPYFAALGAAGALLLWQARAVDLDSPADCLAKFKSNTYVGLILFAGAVVGFLI